MRIIAGTTDFKILRPTAVAIGKFDGFHRGHKELLNQILQVKSEGLLSTIFTFDPPPEVLFGKRQAKEITTKEEKRIIFEKMGVDILIEYPLNEISAAIKPEDFVKEVLKEKMNMTYLAAGYDLSFGHNGAGNAELLRELAPELEFELKIIEKVCEEGREISSTFIREEVEKGNMNHVTKLLGEPYMVIGQVVHGAKLGRRIGMPTINLLPEKEKMLPDEEAERQMYHITDSILQKAGYHRYEISNYAKPGRECRHNVGYWTGVPYLGLGLGASSYIDGCRFCNNSDLNEYLIREPGERFDEIVLTEQDMQEEYFFVGLRLVKGVSMDGFEKQFGVAAESVYPGLMRHLIREGVAELGGENGDFFRLTDFGMDVSNYVMAQFLLEK
mgnify:CR=1 FL=1